MLLGQRGGPVGVEALARDQGRTQQAGLLGDLLGIEPLKGGVGLDRGISEVLQADQGLGGRNLSGRRPGGVLNGKRRKGEKAASRLNKATGSNT